MLAAFCDALGLDAVDLVGNDSGGAVAQIFAVDHAERLRTLTLTNTDTHTNLPPEAFKGTVELARGGQLAPLAKGMLDNLGLARSRAGLGIGYEHPDEITDEALRAYLEPLAATPQAGRDVERFIASFDAEHLVSIEPRLRRQEVPTLIVWGTGDVFFDLSWAYWLRDTIPGAHEVVEIEGARLFFPEERAADLVPHLRRHWSGHAPS